MTGVEVFRPRPRSAPRLVAETVLNRWARRAAASQGSQRVASRKAESGIRHRVVITSDGVRLSVREYGSDTADHTVVLLHGLCMDKDSWNLQVAQLMRERGNTVRIITYDHRGHGDSGTAPMRTYRIERLADDLAELLVVLGVTGPLTLAGHSMGGMAVLAYLGRPVNHRPVEPENLVLVGTAAGKVAERGVGRLLATRATDLVYGLVHRGPRTATDAAVRALTGPLCGALTRYGGYGKTSRDALIAVSAASVNHTLLTTKVGFLQGLKEHDQYGTLGSITARTTVISGGADKLIPSAHADELAAGIPGATHLHRLEAGHMLLHEVPWLVSGAISRAIASDHRIALAIDQGAPAGPSTKMRVDIGAAVEPFWPHGVACAVDGKCCCDSSAAQQAGLASPMASGY
jgi:pimeloyl-ACP methyl ester carboxylesterase